MDAAPGNLTGTEDWPTYTVILLLNVVCCLSGPFTVPVDEEVESQHLKFIQNVPAGMSFAEAVSRFNSNVSYSGLLHAVTADVCHVLLCVYVWLSDTCQFSRVEL